MTERRLAAILCADVAGYTRLTGADEEGTIARLRALRNELIDPLIATHRGRVVKRTGDGTLVEFASVVDALRCAVEVQRGMAPRNAELPEEKRILFRVGINVGDVVVEGDDLLGDCVNISARLEGLAEPGSICLSEDAWRQVKDRVPANYVDRGKQRLKNVAQPVRVFSVTVDGSPVSAAAPAPDRAAPPRLSIVVLPFANIGGDPEQDYFVDGVTESLTTDLSRIAGSFVIARNTAFTYKGKPNDVKQIGRELNVRYVLEGSVQRAGNRMRVNVQLIDADTGSHLWAERFDKPVADLFDMQDEIVARLAGALHSRLVAVEAARAERSPDPDSLDLHYQGLASIHKGTTPAHYAQARAFFERALALDPGNLEALIATGFVDVVVGALFHTDDRAARLAAGEATLTKALTLIPDHARAQLALGMVLMYTHRAEQGIAEGERALALDRNLAFAHALIGHGKQFVGRGEEAVVHVNEALRLSPRDTDAYIWMAIAAGAMAYVGQDDRAVEWARRSIEANPNHPLAHIVMAASLARLGRIEEARRATATGLALNPTFVVSRFRARSLRHNPAFLEQNHRLCDALLQAGVPEG